MVHTPETSLPPLWRDRSFWGMNITQFLGAFNDNLFKQIILLFCLDRHAAGGSDHQTTAQALFALAFVFFSGFAGYLADKYSKRRIIVISKIAEIVVMVLGLIAFLIGLWAPGPLLWFLLFVLCFMGVQSAFFGPSKYGILPEMLRNDDLPQANGLIQMTTFMAIILGTALAGYGKEVTENSLWQISLFCVGIAIIGTLTSLLIRPTPIAKPNLKFKASALVMTTSTREMLWRDRTLLAVLLISSLFWLIGGVVQLAVNQLGKGEMLLGDGRTSLMTACMGIGIGIGCLLAGRLSHHQINFELVRKGAWGIVIFLFLVPLVGQYSFPAVALPTETKSVTDSEKSETENEPVINEGTESTPVDSEVAVAGVNVSAVAANEYWRQETLWQKLWPVTFWEFATRVALIGVGLCAGLFAVPLQTFMQSRPPADQKGQMIGAMNLINWIGILMGALFLGVMQKVLGNLEMSEKWVFPVLACMMLPVALFFKPPSQKLPHQVAPQPTTGEPSEEAPQVTDETSASAEGN